MDKQLALRLESELKGKEFIGYPIEGLLNHGKSAAVFKAIDKTKGIPVAIKIFDSALIERFGRDVQEKRIEEERKLIGHSIPNLVHIIDGGKTIHNSEEYHYIVMQFIEGENLKEYIQSKEYDNKFIKKTFESIFKVSEALLKIGIAHRDIKPENIMIDKDGTIILMDLGVIKVIGSPSITDEDERQFITTLRYSPPEYIERKEEDSISGWKSFNLYQIGGVMHDLIMKKELFADVSPYTKLVVAILDDTPSIPSNPNLQFETLQIARNLLIKDWKLRLSFCPDKVLNEYINEVTSESSLEKEIESHKLHTSNYKIQFEEIEKMRRTNEERKKKSVEISTKLETRVFNSLEILQSKDIFKKVERLSGYVNLSVNMHTGQTLKDVVYLIEGELPQGFPRPLALLVKMLNDDNSLIDLSAIGIFSYPGSFATLNPQAFFTQVAQRNQQPRARIVTPNTLEVSVMNNSVTINNPPFFPIYRGITVFDKDFLDIITMGLFKIIKKSLNNERVESEVSRELTRRKESNIANTQKIRVVVNTMQDDIAIGGDT